MVLISRLSVSKSMPRLKVLERYVAISEWLLRYTANN